MIKRFLDKLLPWRRTITALRAELEIVESRAKMLEATLQRSKRNVELLSEFIKRSHRLNVPFDTESVRAALQNGMNKL